MKEVKLNAKDIILEEVKYVCGGVTSQSENIEVDGEEERGSLASDHLAASSSRLIRRKQGETSSLLFTVLYRPPVNPATWPFHFSQV